MNELIKYSKQGLVVLREGCIMFRDTFIKIFNIYPFQSFTLAQLCMKIYRREFLKPNTIAVVKDYYRDIYSKIAKPRSL